MSEIPLSSGGWLEQYQPAGACPKCGAWVLVPRQAEPPYPPPAVYLCVCRLLPSPTEEKTPAASPGWGWTPIPWSPVPASPPASPAPEQPWWEVSPSWRADYGMSDRGTQPTGTTATAAAENPGTK